MAVIYTHSLRVNVKEEVYASNNLADCRGVKGNGWLHYGQQRQLPKSKGTYNTIEPRPRATIPAAPIMPVFQWGESETAPLVFTSAPLVPATAGVTFRSICVGSMLGVLESWN